MQNVTTREACIAFLCALLTGAVACMQQRHVASRETCVAVHIPGKLEESIPGTEAHITPS